ncbi:unnamed protein product [Ambrosiozyma monospora]|uniref:Unnamed protein product n=1 Tax=Ambrosiozyma monospora TaxID=43982 RepID=A0ACB5SYK8_AMBMO|nr:unnamed protein product [Ambrosiozyma monospora]
MAIMKEAGPVRKIQLNPQINAALVEFENVNGCGKAEIKFDGKVIGGKAIKIGSRQDFDKLTRSTKKTHAVKPQPKEGETKKDPAKPEPKSNEDFRKMFLVSMARYKSKPLKLRTTEKGRKTKKNQPVKSFKKKNIINRISKNVLPPDDDNDTYPEISSTSPPQSIQSRAERRHDRMEQLELQRQEHEEEITSSDTRLSSSNHHHLLTRSEKRIMNINNPTHLNDHTSNVIGSPVRLPLLSSPSVSNLQVIPRNRLTTIEQPNDIRTQQPEQQQREGSQSEDDDVEFVLRHQSISSEAGSSTIEHPQDTSTQQQEQNPIEGSEQDNDGVEFVYSVLRHQSISSDPGVSDPEVKNEIKEEQTELPQTAQTNDVVDNEATAGDQFQNSDISCEESEPHTENIQDPTVLHFKMVFDEDEQEALLPLENFSDSSSDFEDDPVPKSTPSGSNLSLQLKQTGTHNESIDDSSSEDCLEPPSSSEDSSLIHSGSIDTPTLAEDVISQQVDVNAYVNNNSLSTILEVDEEEQDRRLLSLNDYVNSMVGEISQSFSLQTGKTQQQQSTTHTTQLELSNARLLIEGPPQDEDVPLRNDTTNVSTGSGSDETSPIANNHNTSKTQAQHHSRLESSDASKFDSVSDSDSDIQIIKIISSENPLLKKPHRL